MLPTKGPERRHTPRTTVEKFTYINIEPNNGGSVLNVSEGGLCFHSIAPVQASKDIRIWFSEHNRRIEVEGELAWTDATRKTGGLRFTTLPAEARDPIRNWISPPTTHPLVEEAFAPSFRSRRALPSAGPSRPSPETASGISEPLPVVATRVRLPKQLRGFWGGLTIGLLVSMLVAGAFLFSSYRRQLGESLIHLGERLGAKTEAPMQPVSPALSQTVLPAQRTAAHAPAPIPPPRLEKLPPQALAHLAKSQRPWRIDPAPPNPARRTIVVVPSLKPPAVTSAAAISSMHPTISWPTGAVAPASPVVSGKPSIPKLAPQSKPTGPAQNPSDEAVRSNPGIYLEVGKFKNASEADKARDKLTELGFQATVNQQSRLWMNSYYLLVGPYGEDKAEAARKNLASHGLKPRAFEKGSRNLAVYGGCDTMSRLLRSVSIPNGAGLAAEDCVISWESYSTHTVVKFVRENDVVATAEGRWVNRGLRFERDAFVYRKNDDGSRTLLEIQFAGMSQALVFGKSS